MYQSAAGFYAEISVVSKRCRVLSQTRRPASAPCPRRLTGLAVPVICPSVSASVARNVWPASKAALKGLEISGSSRFILSTPSPPPSSSSSSPMLPLPYRRHSPSSSWGEPPPVSLPLSSPAARSGPVAPVAAAVEGAPAPAPAACLLSNTLRCDGDDDAGEAAPPATATAPPPRLRTPAGVEELDPVPAATGGGEIVNARTSLPGCLQT